MQQSNGRRVGSKNGVAISGESEARRRWPPGTWDVKKTCKEWDEIPTNLNWLDGFLSQIIYLFWDALRSHHQDDTCMCRRLGIPTIKTLIYFIRHCYWSYGEGGASQCMPGTSGTVAWPGCFWLDFELLFLFWWFDGPKIEGIQQVPGIQDSCFERGKSIYTLFTPKGILLFYLRFV